MVWSLVCDWIVDGSSVDGMNKSDDSLGEGDRLYVTVRRSSSVGFSIMIGSFGGTINLRFGGDSAKAPGIGSVCGSGVLDRERLANAKAYGCAGPGLPFSANRGERRGRFAMVGSGVYGGYQCSECGVQWYCSVLEC